MQFIDRIILKKKLEKRFEGIKIKYTKNKFECDIEKQIVYLPKEKNPKSDFYFWTWYEKYYNTRIDETELFLLSMLHEIGHIMTWTEELEEERDEQFGLLQALYELSNLTTRQLNNQYFEIPMELQATEWAKNYFEKNFKKPLTNQNEYAII